MAKEKQEPILQTAAIRLAADETRTIIKAANSKEPIIAWRDGQSLAEMGLLRKVKIVPPDNRGKLVGLWKEAKAAVAARKRSEAQDFLSQIGRIEKDAQTEQYGYILTDLGKQVARGITVRINSQYAK